MANNGDPAFGVVHLAYDKGYTDGLLDGHAATVERIRMAVFGSDLDEKVLILIEGILNREEVSLAE